MEPIKDLRLLDAANAVATGLSRLPAVRQVVLVNLLPPGNENPPAAAASLEFHRFRLLTVVGDTLVEGYGRRLSAQPDQETSNRSDSQPGGRETGGKIALELLGTDIEMFCIGLGGSESVRADAARGLTEDLIEIVLLPSDQVHAALRQSFIEGMNRIYPPS